MPVGTDAACVVNRAPCEPRATPSASDAEAAALLARLAHEPGVCAAGLAVAQAFPVLAVGVVIRAAAATRAATAVAAAAAATAPAQAAAAHPGRGGGGSRCPHCDGSSGGVAAGVDRPVVAAEELRPVVLVGGRLRVGVADAHAVVFLRPSCSCNGRPTSSTAPGSRS